MFLDSGCFDSRVDESLVSGNFVICWSLRATWVEILDSRFAFSCRFVNSATDTITANAASVPQRSTGQLNHAIGPEECLTIKFSI